ncbi:MAG: DUF1320 family protein [Oligoflexia bacterium]|nr:DUF1320 family protein [Oligoflexia bacterium]
MSYCTIEHIQEEFNDIKFSDETLVKIDRVSRFIAEASAYIDGSISSLYNVPIDYTSSPQSFLILQSICIDIVVSKIKDITKINKDNSADKAGSGYTKKEYDVKIDKILNRKLLLNDCPLKKEQSIYIETSELEFNSIKW